MKIAASSLQSNSTSVANAIRSAMPPIQNIQYTVSDYGDHLLNLAKYV